MKPKCIPLLLGLTAQIASAQPAVYRHVHQHRDPGRLRRKTGGDRTVTDSNVPEPTRVPQVIVYVNQEGTPVSTTTETIILSPSKSLSTSTDHPADETTLPSTTISGIQEEVKDPATANGEMPPKDTSIPTDDDEDDGSASIGPTANSGQADGGEGQPNSVPRSNLYGVAYAPYNADGTCKSADQVDDDLTILAASYSLLRIYGTDCDQVTHVVASARKLNIKLFLGLFELGPIEQQVSTVIEAVGQDWGVVDTVSVGNELVNNGQASPQQVVNAVAKVRQLLRAGGYPGPVVTVDTFIAVQAHPELCEISDYCAINCHPFFDPNTAPEDAGTFVRDNIARIQSVLSDKGKRIVVTETGWPWQGTSNGKAVPGVTQQQTALASIRDAFAGKPHDVIFFSAFNDRWKKEEAGTFYAERYWGIDGANSPAGG